jgi:histidyl-tRNA synthetase
VAARANGLKKPIRWFSIPQLFRYERQQRGRLREHFQLNCDLIGEAGPLADAEIIALAIDVMRAFGFTPADVKVRISDRSLLNTVLGAMGIKGEQLALAYQALDKMGRREFADIRQALEAAGVPAALIGELESLRSLDNLSDVSRRFPQARTQVESLERVFAALQAMGLSDFVALDLTIVRGLAYYTGTVFELFDASRSMRAICGGGRYDTLLQSLGGPELPALGFGMGDVVLADLLRDRELKPMEEPSIDVFLAGISNDDLPHVLALAHRLREAGVRVEYALSTQSLGKQLKLADARNARLVVVLGPDERARGELVIKDLRGQAQETVSEASAVDALKARLNG